MLKRTPLFEAHQKLGAKLIDFGGWEMPVQYTSIIEEHKAVRETAGLFDISHMGEFEIGGPFSGEFVNQALTNDASRLEIGEGHYTQICNERGGIIDDLYCFRTAVKSFLLVVNASRIAEDWGALVARRDAFLATEECSMHDQSGDAGAIALQGPEAATMMRKLSGDACDLAKNRIGSFQVAGLEKPVWISRTGYTGEDGFEIICANDEVRALWDRLIEVGARPCGLGARDTLRTEVCYPLYGHELDEDTTPIEAGIGWSVALDKGDFIGRDALVAQKEAGVDRRLIAFKMTGRSAPPRQGYPIWSVGDDAKRIGEVTSGTQSPSLGIGIGLGHVSREHARRDTPIEIEIRGRRTPAAICAKPIYSKNQSDT